MRSHTFTTNALGAAECGDQLGAYVDVHRSQLRWDGFRSQIYDWNRSKGASTNRVYHFDSGENEMLSGSTAWTTWLVSRTLHPTHPPSFNLQCSTFTVSSML